MAADVSTLFEQLNAVMPADKAAKFQKPLAENLSAYSQANTQLSSTSLDRRAQEAFNTSTENAQVVTLRDRRDELKRQEAENNELIKAAIEQIKAHLQPELSDEQKAELRKNRKVAQKTVDSMLDTLITLAETYLDNADELAKAAKEFKGKFSKGSRAGGGGSSAPKARVAEIHAVHPNGQDVTESTFSKVGLRTKLAPSEMAAAYLAASGQEDWRKITEPVNFMFGEWSMTVTPKSQDEKSESDGDSASTESSEETPVETPVAEVPASA